MFEATFKIAALVENNEQGQHVFQVLKNGDQLDDAGFLSLVSKVYQQDVYRKPRVKLIWLTSAYHGTKALCQIVGDLDGLLLFTGAAPRFLQVSARARVFTTLYPFAHP